MKLNVVRDHSLDPGFVLKNAIKVQFLNTWGSLNMGWSR